MNFINADPAAKFTLVQDSVKYWDLAASGTSEPLKVTKRRKLEGLMT